MDSVQTVPMNVDEEVPISVQEARKLNYRSYLKVACCYNKRYNFKLVSTLQGEQESASGGAPSGQQTA